LPKRGRKRYKGNATTISLWTKQPRVRPKATSTRRIQQQNNNKVRGQDTYLYALSGPTLSKANGHPPYKDKHDKEKDTYLIALDEHTQSKAESSRKNKVQSHVQTPGKLTSQDMKKILDHTRIKGHHPDTSSGDTQRAR
jgi:hypothetical protein